MGVLGYLMQNRDTCTTNPYIGLSPSLAYWWETKKRVSSATCLCHRIHVFSWSLAEPDGCIQTKLFGITLWARFLRHSSHQLDHSTIFSSSAASCQFKNQWRRVLSLEQDARMVLELVSWCVSWGLRAKKASVLSQTRAPTGGLKRPLAGVTNRGFTLHYRRGISSQAKGCADSLPRALLHNENCKSCLTHPTPAIKVKTVEEFKWRKHGQGKWR